MGDSRERQLDMAMTLRKLYETVNVPGPDGQRALETLQELDWLTCTVEFDHVSGAPIPLPLTRFLFRIADLNALKEGRDTPSLTARAYEDEFPHDRVWRIADHVRESMSRLMRGLNESPAREHEVMYVGKVRELDAASFVKLSNRPGRTIREKLASKPYLQAVRRYMSLDIAENRLLKACAKRLLEVLESRHALLRRLHGEHVAPDRLMDEIARWLRTDEAKSISRWENTPPNNTLISHRDYKRVWDAWLWLQTLDEQTDNDYNAGVSRKQIVSFWSDYALAWKTAETMKLAEMPVSFAYDRFRVETWSDGLPLVLGRKVKFVRDGDIGAASVMACRAGHELSRPQPVESPVCVDLTEVYPRYCEDGLVKTLPVKLVWQRWERANEIFPFCLFGADVVWQHAKARTIAFADLFNPQDGESFEVRLMRSQAARRCATELRKLFRNDDFVWLTPDSRHELELTNVRENINAVFPKAHPLPRSVAMAFSLDANEIRRNIVRRSKGADLCEYDVLVVDSAPDGLWVTKMTAQYSERLFKAVPESQGICWVRNPTQLMSEGKVVSALSTVDQIDSEGRFVAGTRAVDVRRCPTESELRRNENIGSFDRIVSVNERVLVGGMRERQIERLAGDIPVWKNCLPDLTTKIPIDGVVTPFAFVQDAKIAVRQGVATQIPINRRFCLQPGQKSYHFRLYQGHGELAMQYEATLESSDFPLDKSVECRLEMTYTYGIDKTYRLVFVPIGAGSVAKIEANWTQIGGGRKIVNPNELPYLPFPMARSWNDFHRFPKKNSVETSDLFDWIRTGLSAVGQMNVLPTLSRFIQDARVSRREGRVIKSLYDKNGDVYCFVEVDGAGSVFCHSSGFVGSDDMPDEGSKAWLCIEKDKKQRWNGWAVAFDEEASAARLRCVWEKQFKMRYGWKANNLSKQINGLRFPFLMVWGESRSLHDVAVPTRFRDMVLREIPVLVELVKNSEASADVRDNAYFLLSCLHRDAPRTVVDMLLTDVGDADLFFRYFRNFAYAIGDGVLDWQRQLLFSVVSWIRLNQCATEAIKVLSVALWRSERLLGALVAEDLRIIRGGLLLKMKKHTESLSAVGQMRGTNNFLRSASAISSQLELLLAMLRSRSFSDVAVNTLLIPDSAETQELVDALDRLTRVVVDRGIQLKTRLKFKDRGGDCGPVPEILRVTRQYLTNEDVSSMPSLSTIEEDE